MTKQLIIDDTNYQHFVDGGQHAGGRVFGAAMVPGRARASGLTLADVGIPIIPEAEWPDRIAAKNKAKSWLKDMTYDLDSLNQRSEGQCWLFGNCGAMRSLSVRQGGMLRLPSPQSLVYIIEGYRNWGCRGGDPADSAQALHETGAARDELWPADPNVGRNRKYATDAAEADRANNMAVLMVELGHENKIWPEVVSCLLQDIPVGVCFEWWYHHVEGCYLDYDREVRLGIRNSWGNDGFGNDRGFGLLAGQKKYPSGAWAFVEMTQAS